jgi:hypothetical protein
LKLSNNFEPANILRWEMWGILFIVLLGSLLHFSFNLTGGLLPVGIVSAVNESVWEHLKLVFWPTVFWTVVEYFLVVRKGRDVYPNFLLAKAIGAYVMPAVIVTIFYSYTAFTGSSILAVDLSSFIVAVIIGQFVSYRLWGSLNIPSAFNWLGLAMFLIVGLLFAGFTFYPPHAGIFQDPPTGGYGILPS